MGATQNANYFKGWEMKQYSPMRLLAALTGLGIVSISLLSYIHL